jgi:pectin methylesterase-like acyl-CoA thioesterase
VKADTPPNLIQANRAPRVTDKGNKYPVGTIWIDASSGTSYQLTRYTAGIPNWEEVAGNGGYPITPYVVGAIGQAGYQSIQSAIDAAHAAGGNGYIFVQPGTYNENLTFYDGITINGTIVLSGFQLCGSF